MGIEANQRIFHPNLEIQDQLEAIGIDHLEDVTGLFPDELLPPSRERWQVGNLNADLSNLEIPTKLLKADDLILRCAYIDLKDDRQMYMYGCGMSWTYPLHFMKEFPAKIVENITPNRSVEHIQLSRTDADYINAARAVFESLYVQNPDRILGAEFIETDDDEELAGIYLNMGEYEYIYPRDGYLDEEDKALVELFNKTAFQERLVEEAIPVSSSSPDVSSMSTSNSISASASEVDELSISGEDSKPSSPAPASSQTPSPDLQQPSLRKKIITSLSGYYRSTG
ncbi:MAG: hypothetical protein JSR39_01455 [Verrucomicrobia bacterium]|nr:hypothetical protein [Verrucomicrobiota bacterium]